MSFKTLRKHYHDAYNAVYLQHARHVCLFRYWKISLQYAHYRKQYNYYRTNMIIIVLLCGSVMSVNERKYTYELLYVI